MQSEYFGETCSFYQQHIITVFMFTVRST